MSKNAATKVVLTKAVVTKAASPKSAVRAASADTASVYTASVKSAAAKRPRGRPPQRSVEAILEKAMELLATRPPEDISMVLVAESLGIPTMSLYNYFPNHAALLNALGDHAFSLFRFSKTHLRKPWQEALMAWLWAVDRHFERHPIAFKMMSVEGQVSPAWTKVQEPLLQVMADLGLKGKELTFALCWFTSQAIGLMLVEASAHASRQLSGHLQATSDSAVADQVLRELARHKPAIRRQDVLEFGFRGIISSLEKLLPAHK